MEKNKFWPVVSNPSHRPKRQRKLKFIRASTAQAVESERKRHRERVGLTGSLYLGGCNEILAIMNSSLRLCIILGVWTPNG